MKMTLLLRSVYTGLFYLLIPLLLLRLLWRSRRNPAYRQRMSERFGFAPVLFEKSLWVHAVSVGESLLAVALIKKLRLLYPALPIVVTTMTPTGAARIQAALADSVSQVYIPYDLPAAVNRFLHRVNPLIAIIMETELWPHLFQACHKRHIPIVIANARLSKRSAAGYARIALFTREMLTAVSLLMAQGKEDAERYIALGMDPRRVQVTGNIKFDLELPADLVPRSEVLRMHLGKDRPIWIAASTHAGEEEIVLKAHALIRNSQPRALLVLVPRHPDRFAQIAEWLAQQGIQYARRSLGEACNPATAVYLGDTMGELLLLYAATDVAFVGGSLVGVGGHNLLEPAALAKPVMSGPQLFNFTEITALLEQAHALEKVVDADSLAATVLHFFAEPALAQQKGKAAQRVVESNRGALAKHIDLIAGVIGSAQSLPERAAIDTIS